METPLLELVKYIHLNPLRAGIVGNLEVLESYPWCGHWELLGIGTRKLITEHRIRPSYFPVWDILKDTFKSIELLYERKELVIGVPSGYHELDKMTAGMQPSDLVIIAGRPSMGKTAFALNLAEYATTHSEKKVSADYLQLMRGSDPESRQQEISENSRSLGTTRMRKLLSASSGTDRSAPCI